PRACRGASTPWSRRAKPSVNLSPEARGLWTTAPAISRLASPRWEGDERMSGCVTRLVSSALLSLMVLIAVAGAAGARLARAQAHEGHGAAGAGAAATSPKLLGGLSDQTHPIATTSPEAQKYFDMGLNLAFAFNKEEAVRAFRKAAELDPKAAMAQWGIAYALGPDINTPRDPGRDKEAAAAIAKARTL